MTVSRHTVLAYLLLFVVLLLVLKLVLIPVVGNLQTQRQTTNALTKKVFEAKSALSHAEQLRVSISSELKLLFESGEISSASQASDASYRLQARIKTLLESHAINITQLRPSTESLPEGLMKSRLELNMRASAESIQGLLMSLSNSKPSLHIELIRINNTSKHSAGVDKNLDLSLSIATWFLDQSLVRVDAGWIGESIEITSANTAEEAQSSTWGTNQLAGLFDINTRLRLRSPSPDHYRLAAINVSKSARIAIIANSVGGQTRRLKQGEFLDAWRVESIDSNGVTLTLGDKKEFLNLSR